MHWLELVLANPGLRSSLEAEARLGPLERLDWHGLAEEIVFLLVDSVAAAMRPEVG